MWKKIGRVIASVALLTMAAVGRVGAEETSSASPTVGEPNGNAANFDITKEMSTRGGAHIKFNSVSSLLSGITFYVAMAAIVFFFVLVLTSGYRIVFAGDQKGSLDQARRNLTMGIIGLVVVAFSFAIVNIVKGLMGVD